MQTIFVIGLLISVGGCGESKQDLFMKHAQRDRGGADDDADDEPRAAARATQSKPTDTEKVANKPSPQAPAQPQIAETKVPSEPSEEAPAETETVPEEENKSLSELVGIKPIDERKPEEELSVADRRRRSFENLQKINEALLSYALKEKNFPREYSTNRGGVPTLSWRVKLLPYLGYEELYKKFDFSRAWNMPPNKELLQYIPDEYVSPERFDVKTNYVFPIDGAFIFGDNRLISPAMIDDGAENTIMLLEVNDPHAVNWTEPKDLKPKSVMNMKSYIGKLRADGTFALWASGFPVLLENGLTNQQLFEAMTYEKADALRAGDIHRTITVAEAEADPEAETPMTEDVAGVETPATPAFIPPEIPGTYEQAFAREEVPSSVELNKAQDKLRRIFRDKLDDANDSDKKGDLASELIDVAREMDADPSGAFALQQAAMLLAIEAADANVLIRAIDQRVARFEVNSFRENLKWIQEFGEATAGKDSKTVSGDAILRRAVPVIYAGVREDEYMLASSVARIASRYAGTDRDDVMKRLFNRLRSQLGAAKREYDKSVVELERYRANPRDAKAGVAFGTFLCFIKGDWKRGLELIGKGDGGDLVEVARMDLRGASNPRAQAEIGDAWWDLSRRGAGAYRQGAQDRAVLWYTQAFERLPESLDRIHVKNRLNEADETDGRSPIALCMQLADEIGVDLNQSLTSIAVQGSRRGKNRRDEDD
ncbi:MAG: DUF1559 domain-containing protein [Planctomycetota bacterium]